MATPYTPRTCPTYGRVHPESFLTKVTTDYRWTTFVLIVLIALVFFLWGVFDRESFVTAVNTFTNALTTVAAVLFVFGICVAWVRYALSGKKKGSH